MVGALLMIVYHQLGALRLILAAQSAEAASSSSSSTSSDHSAQLDHERCKAINLEDQIAAGKWQRYDFVLDNCLVWKFIDDRGHKQHEQEDINFYALLEEQKVLTNRLLDYYQTTLRQPPKSAADQGNKIKLELKLKANRRHSNRAIAKLNKLDEQSRMKVALMEVEVRELMDRCNLASHHVMDQQQHQHQQQQRGASGGGDKSLADCAKSMNETFDRVGELCDNLRGQNAILMAMKLDRQLDQQ